MRTGVGRYPCHAETSHVGRPRRQVWPPSALARMESPPCITAHISPGRAGVVLIAPNEPISAPTEGVVVSVLIVCQERPSSVECSNETPGLVVSSMRNQLLGVR